MNDSTTEIVRDLGNGLVLRRGHARDADKLVEFLVGVFGNPDTGEPDRYLGGWVRDLVSPQAGRVVRHPTFRPNDFLIVQDLNSQAIVSCSCLISQTWTYDGISFGVGRIEVVATAPEYRRRGLIREQFRVLHEWSAERGELAQAITGIPYYYRQFGYEYAIELAAARKTFVPQQVPEIEKGKREAYRLRRATRKDLAFLVNMNRQAAERSLVACARNEAILAREQFGENDAHNGAAGEWDVIETREREPIGAVMHLRFLFHGRLTVYVYELLPNFSWTDVTPGVMRALVQKGTGMKSADGTHFGALGWSLVETHPYLRGFPSQLSPISSSYAWLIRVSDLVAFLKRIAPVLEKRVAASPFGGHTGALKLNMFKSGVELILEQGKLAEVRNWNATAMDYGQSGFGNATFPDQTFLKMLFGYRSRAELHDMFPDCLVDHDTTGALFDVLFPKYPSHVLPIH